jgi:hypothetical protein
LSLMNASMQLQMFAPFRTSPAQGPPLRIGILLDSPKLSAFFARIIEDIQASNFARIELLVYRKKPAATQAQPKSCFGALKNRVLNPTLRKRALYDAYLKFDERMKPRNHPLDAVDCSRVLTGIQSIEVEPIGKKFIHKFPPDAIDKIRAANLDVILRFGFNILSGEILTVARYGVWSYHHGDNDHYRGGPPHFWELVEKAPLSGVILQVLTEELDGGLVLCKSLFTTEQTTSASVNRYTPYWGSTDMVIRKLNELHRCGWDYVKSRALGNAPYEGKRKIYRMPTNSEMVRWLAPTFLKKAAEYPFRQKTVQHWKIAVRVGQQGILESRDTDVSGFRWIEPPKDHFWADPFLIENGGKHWIFFEDYFYPKRRAGIACAEILQDGRLASQQTCLESEHHYSYPQVFHSGEDLWMVPESLNSNSVDLYRCIEFPTQWAREKTLLAGRFVDTTIWQHDGLWWLMTTRAEPDSRAGSLFLFYSDSLTGDWNFHPANPISTDIRNNRGAGNLFLAGGHIIRPSQSCCPIYGYSFSFNEISKLSPECYSEKALRTVTPWGGFCAVHTYNRAGNIEVIDGAIMMPLRKLLSSGNPARSK